MERGTGERMEEGAVGPKSQRADIFALNGFHRSAKRPYASERTPERRYAHTPLFLWRQVDGRR
jgi:hypothetical protein